MKRIRAACVPLDFDLRPVIAALRRAGCRLQVSEESGEQVVWVWDVSQVEPLQRLIEAQRRGEFVVHENLAANQNRGYAQAGVALIWRLSLFLKSCPLASTIAALCLIIALMSQLGRDLRGLEGLFFPPLLFSSFLELALELIEPSLFLRSLTPALLHFGEIHLVFNLLWLFYFGRQIERVQPLLLVAVVYVVITLAGNVAQYYLTGSNAFGGLSGLIYGLVGYTWLLGIMVPNIAASHYVPVPSWCSSLPWLAWQFSRAAVLLRRRMRAAFSRGLLLGFLWASGSAAGLICKVEPARYPQADLYFTEHNFYNSTV